MKINIKQCTLRRAYTRRDKDLRAMQNNNETRQRKRLGGIKSNCFTCARFVIGLPCVVMVNCLNPLLT